MAQRTSEKERPQGDKKPFWSQQGGRSYQSPYEMWKEQEGLPTLRGYIVYDLPDMELTPWASRGGSGVFINLDGGEGFADAYVCEIPPGKSLSPLRHIYEDTILILKGRGATTVWLDEKKKQTFEWGERSYFALPPNAWYQHHNGSGSEPARFVGSSAAPRVINTFKDLDFVFNNPYQFRDRFSDDGGYFQDTFSGTPTVHFTLTSNFVTDVVAVTARADDPKGLSGRGAAHTGVSFNMTNSTMKSHTAEYPVGIHVCAHRHGPGIHIINITSRGYSLMWPEGGPVVRVDYGPGSIFAPPEMWWHQHFNTGPEPLLHLAVGWGSEKPKRGGGAYYYTNRDGDQHDAKWDTEDVITLEKEDPQIHRDFETALAKAGIQCNMGHVHPCCTQK